MKYICLVNIHRNYVVSCIPEYDVNVCVHVCMHACVFVGRNVCECLCVNELIVYLSLCDIIKNTSCVE